MFGVSPFPSVGKQPRHCLRAKELLNSSKHYIPNTEEKQLRPRPRPVSPGSGKMTKTFQNTTEPKEAKQISNMEREACLATARKCKGHKLGGQTGCKHGCLPQFPQLVHWGSQGCQWVRQPPAEPLSPGWVRGSPKQGSTSVYMVLDWSQEDLSSDADWHLLTG